MILGLMTGTYRRHRRKLYGHNGKRMMLTDIKESDKGYELEMDLPGFKKDEIKASLENGYLTITAEKGLEKDQKEEAGQRKVISAESAIREAVREPF